MTDNVMIDMDLEYASATAERALRAMATRSVPATPGNFSVWFDYAMGATPTLKKTIDTLISEKRNFDVATNTELYGAYVSARSVTAVAVDVPEQLDGVIASARQFLTTAIADNRIQMAALGEASSEFDVNSNPGPIIKKLMTALSEATTRASALEANFSTTTQELDRIRASLQEAEQRSNTDALTGLANRRSFEEFLRDAQIAAKQAGTPLGMLMIDIDHFKHFNDSYGHQVGDQVLRLVAKVLQDNVRQYDLAARYGGEELIAVLPGAVLEVCARSAERIRLRVSEARLTRRTTGKEISSVTISVGVAQFNSSDTPETMIERCDRAMYQAKRAGRNQTVTENQLEALAS